MKKAIIFDLGNTLVDFFQLEEFPYLLKKSLSNVSCLLNKKKLLTVNNTELKKIIPSVDYEKKNNSVFPLFERLNIIYNLSKLKLSNEAINEIHQEFSKPIFANYTIFEDTLPTLNKLTEMKLKIGIISNTPWGMPSFLWKNELKRMNLFNYFDVITFCSDVGWRKPSPFIFSQHLLDLGVKPDQCLLVGDDPIVDIEGALNCGMDAKLLERAKSSHNCLRSLYDITKYI